MKQKKIINKKLFDLRRELHQHPELSGNEKQTSERIIKFISQFKPDETITGLGGHGVAFIFKGKQKGPSILLRSDLDALPIEETNDFNYKSVNNKVSHTCGHDGHMTILAGLAAEISITPNAKGNIILLFQPAEETGQGARLVLKDKKFEKIKPDYVFALHNLPEYNKHNILVRNNSFAAASKGMVIKLFGKTSHAGEPEKGLNPAKATARIMERLINLPKINMLFRDFVLLTIIHVSLGEIAFGTSPGYAEIRATIRANKNRDMKILTKEAESLVARITSEEKLKFEISYTEDFSAVENNREAVRYIKTSAKENKYKLQIMPAAFRWSEDFSHFTNKYKGAMFGLGAGVDTPKLHNPDYDFPDEIIETGINMFSSIYKNILK